MRGPVAKYVSCPLPHEYILIEELGATLCYATTKIGMLL
jgi:hypothetical protein